MFGRLTLKYQMYSVARPSADQTRTTTLLFQLPNAKCTAILSRLLYPALQFRQESQFAALATSIVSDPFLIFLPTFFWLIN